jgi:hypothetical protein
MAGRRPREPFPPAGHFEPGPMLSPAIASWLVLGAAVYLAAGVMFALPFAFRLVNRLDVVAAQGTRPFRALILPGAMLLWPVLLVRLLRGWGSSVEPDPHHESPP